MATQTICPFNKYGYCKHKELCRKHHENKLCDKPSCDISTCSLRHPKNCKWYREYSYCKFNPCAFKHFDNSNSIDMDKYQKENEVIVNKLANIEKEIEKLQQNEEEIVRKRIFDEKILKLESIIAEKDVKIESFVQRIEKMESTIETLEGKVFDLEKNKEVVDTTNVYDEKIKSMEQKIYILDKRRLGSDFCDYCDKEFMSGCEKDRKEKENHVRESHTFECKVCEFKNKNKEELEIHLLTCEIYICSLCSYKHKRLSELKSHCKTKHTRNTIIKHCKMDRDSFSKLSSTNYFSEEI